MRLFKLAVAMSAIGAATAFAAPAMAQNFAAGVSLGTPGAGIVAEAQVMPMLVLRGAVDGMSISHHEDFSDIRYHAKAKFLTVGLFADVHVPDSGFFLSGGAYFGKRELDLRAQPTSNVTIGGFSYTPAQIGRLDGKGKTSKVQPFVGLGYDNTFVGDRDWGFRAMAGVSISKRPKVSLATSGGLLSADPTLQARLRQEEADAEHDGRHLRFFPVVQIGANRRF